MLPPVDVLSGSDGEAVVDVKSSQRAVPSRKQSGRKRKVALLKVSPGAQRLEERLDRDCRCARKSCLRQFLQGEKFAEYKAYALQWNELAKLDQDQIVTSHEVDFLLG